MTPQQKLTIDVNQSIQRVGHLSHWLQRNRPSIGECETGLRQVLKMLTVRYHTLQQAVDLPPGIAVVGESCKLRAEMVRALTLTRDAKSSAQEVGSDDAAILKQMQAAGSAMHRAVAVRYRLADAPVAPTQDHPYRLGLLNIADLAAIMTRVHQICFPHAFDVKATLARLEEIREEVADKVRPATLPGFTQADVYRLKDTFDRLYPDVPALKLLAASDYWDDLAEVAAHISDSERIKVLSILWSGQPDLTMLFRDMVESLARLGYVNEAFCTHEAFVERGPASGTFAAHDESILDARTVQCLADRKDTGVRVVGRYGNPGTLRRSLVAALTTDLTIAIPMPAAAVLAGVDVVDFPTVDLPADLTVMMPRKGKRHFAAAGPSESELLGVFAHVKTLHLLDRACYCHGLTCLVACVEPDSEPTDVLPGVVGDWIELVQGDEPHERERSQMGLFVVAADHADHSQPAIGANGVGEASCAHVSTRIASSIAGSSAWLGEWTPGRPFTNTFTMRLDRRSDPAAATARQLIGTGEDRKADGATNGSHFETSAGRHADDGIVLPCTPIGTRAEAERFLRRVSEVAKDGAKQRQLRRQLADLHRRVRGRLVRYHQDEDPTGLNDWRQRIAAVLDHRLEAVAARNRLGLLLSCLSIDENELVAIYRRSELAAIEARLRSPARQIVDAAADAEGRGAGTPPIPRTLAITLAETVIGYWFAAMRRAAWSERLCREIGLQGWLIEHLVDEIGIGAVRLGLVRRVAEVIETAVARTHGGERSFSSSVGAVLHGFLERFDLDTARPRRAGDPASGAAGNFDAAEANDKDEPSATEVPAPLSESWRLALSAFIRANIGSARNWSATDATADLARLLSEFPQSRFEVES